MWAGRFATREDVVSFLELDVMVTVRAVNVKPVLFMFQVGLGSLRVPDKHLESLL